MAVPMAITSAFISFDASILSSRARSTFKIFPRSGRIACVLRSRAVFAEPPALSPSTIKTSASSGCSSKNMEKVSLNTFSTAPRASTLPNFAFVCPSNWISGSLTEITAVIPSLTSSPERVSSAVFTKLFFLA